MSRFQTKLFFVPTVLILSFGFLSQAQAETVWIENYISSYSNTGGVSSGRDGQDGQDGEDGKDGQDGRPGQAGADGNSYISGNGESTVKLKASVDSKTVVDIVKHASSTNEIKTKVESKEEFEVGSTSFSFDKQQTLAALLDKIHLILLNYVFSIF